MGTLFLEGFGKRQDIGNGCYRYLENNLVRTVFTAADGTAVFLAVEIVDHHIMPEDRETDIVPIPYHVRNEIKGLPLISHFPYYGTIDVLCCYTVPAGDSLTDMMGEKPYAYTPIGLMEFINDNFFKTGEKIDRVVVCQSDEENGYTMFRGTQFKNKLLNCKFGDRFVQSGFKKWSRQFA